jgi:hypothetical protein
VHGNRQLWIDFRLLPERCDDVVLHVSVCSVRAVSVSINDMVSVSASEIVRAPSLDGCYRTVLRRRALT